MRMWGVDPKLLCQKHLCGEHVEMHMFVGTIKKGTSLRGYVEKGLVETWLINSRHNELASEMITRGYNHQSPIELVDVQAQGHVDRLANLAELSRRCPSCANRQRV